MSDYISIAVIAGLVFATACSGAMFVPGPFYDAMRKPWWNPPAWVFPLVWTPLYVCIAIAGWLVWSQDGAGLIMAVWVLQLVFNAAWSWLAFGRKRFDLAFYDLVALWLCVAVFAALAWPVNPTASLLFAPYLVWVTIAGVLNRSVWTLNPETAAG